MIQIFFCKLLQVRPGLQGTCMAITRAVPAESLPNNKKIIWATNFIVVLSNSMLLRAGVSMQCAEIMIRKFGGQAALALFLDKAGHRPALGQLWPDSGKVRSRSFHNISNGASIAWPKRQLENI
jgi:hypothetical protein